jgi:hypothetical protein
MCVAFIFHEADAALTGGAPLEREILAMALAIDARRMSKVSDAGGSGVCRLDAI